MMGFKQSENDYILKEIAIVPLIYDEEPLVRLFKSSFPCRKLTHILCKGKIFCLSKIIMVFHGILMESIIVKLEIFFAVLSRMLQKFM